MADTGAETGTRLFIGNLAWETNDRSLEDLFAKYGIVKEARVAVDRNTGRSRGFGFVTMEDATAADEAVREISGTNVNGRDIRVEVSTGERKPPGERRGGDDRRGGDRGGDRRGGDRRGGDDRRGGGDRYGDDRRGGGRDFDRRGGGRDFDRRGGDDRRGGGRDFDRGDRRDRSRDRGGDRDRSRDRY